MANRRMFSLDITNSDPFIEMDLATQAVYFQLAMSADDDGFINSSLRTLRAIGGSKDHVDELVKRNFIIRFESGILLIRHWYMQNCIGKDRYHPTVHKNEMSQVKLINNIYYLTTEPECIQVVNNLDTQVSIGKFSKEKISKDKDSEGERNKDESPPSFIKPTINELRDYANSIGYFNFNPEVFMGYYSEHDWIDPHTHKPIDWKNRIDLWKARERTSSGSSKPSKNPFNNFEQHDYDFDALEKSLLAN